MMCNDGTNGKAFRDSGLYDGWPPASALADPESASEPSRVVPVIVKPSPATRASATGLQAGESVCQTHLV